MKYYKMINNNQIVGAISSYNFVSYSPVAEGFLHTNEQLGEYISYNGQLYRSTIMKPIVISKEYIPIILIEITEEEYNIYSGAIQNNEEIYEQRQEEIIEDPPFIDMNDVASVEFIRYSKLNEMSNACRQTIEAGFNLEIRGENHHFSLDTQDQLNLISLSAMMQTQEYIPYHADGEACIFYTAEEMNQIITTATQFKIYHTTYYNALKAYINSLETIEEIAAIKYGTAIPEEYQSDVFKTLRI